MTSREFEKICSDKYGVVYLVPSDSDDFPHTVSYDIYDSWWCTCLDYMFRKRFCKHMSRLQKFLQEEGLVIESKKVFKGYSEEDGDCE